MKKFLSLILAVLLATLGLAATALAVDDTPSSDEGYYYVYTENGKGLNVRDAPGGNVVGSLKYGSRIYCYYLEGGTGYALIDYTYDKPGYGKGTYACFVSNRFMVKKKPAPRNSTPSAASKQNEASGTLEEINAEFASAKRVTPYKVTVRPTRASGWVNLRGAPSKSAELVATYGANQQLLVLKEMTNWLQVEDQDTGDVGFISRTFVIE